MLQQKHFYNRTHVLDILLLKIKCFNTLFVPLYLSHLKVLGFSKVRCKPANISRFFLINVKGVFHINEFLIGVSGFIITKILTGKGCNESRFVFIDEVEALFKN